MNNKKGFILSTYVYMLLVFFLLLLTTMLAVMNNTKLLSNKLKEQTNNSSGLVDKDYSFILLGEGDMVIIKGEEYIEPGFKIQTSKKKDLSDIVKITGNVDVNSPNTYKLTYSATYNGITKKLTRNVHVLDDIASNYIIGLYNYKRDENGLTKDNTIDQNIRYSGSNPNNYVYFNDELWRIIGVFDVAKEDGGTTTKRIKLVRNESLITASWDSSASNVNKGWGINQWGESTYNDGSVYEGADIMRLLNGYYIGKNGETCKYCNSTKQNVCNEDCTNNITTLSNTSLTMVDDALWNIGATNYNDLLPANTLYEGERSNTSGKICTLDDQYCSDLVNRTTKWKGKIALIYASDYAYASGEQSCLYDVRGEESTCNLENWLQVKTSGDEYWTLAPQSSSENSYRIWVIGNTKKLEYDNVSDVYKIFPSLYLKSSVKIISGDGTQNNPYKLSI